MHQGLCEQHLQNIREISVWGGREGGMWPLPKQQPGRLCPSEVVAEICRGKMSRLLQEGFGASAAIPVFSFPKLVHQDLL